MNISHIFLHFLSFSTFCFTWMYICGVLDIGLNWKVWEGELPLFLSFLFLSFFSHPFFSLISLSLFFFCSHTNYKPDQHSSNCYWRSSLQHPRSGRKHIQQRVQKGEEGEVWPENEIISTSICMKKVMQKNKNKNAFTRKN